MICHLADPTLRPGRPVLVELGNVGSRKASYFMNRHHGWSRCFPTNDNEMCHHNESHRAYFHDLGDLTITFRAIFCLVVDLAL